MLALGVDLSEDAVTLAAIDRSGRATRLLGTWRDRRSPGASDAEAVRAAIAAHCPSPPDAVATTLAGSRSSFRLLRLPFADPTRLAATIPFEIESLVPFDLDAALTAWTVVERDGASTTVLAAIAARDAVRGHLDEMRDAGIDPAVVDVGAVAVVGLLRQRAASALVVEPRDDGVIALLRDGRIEGLRVIDASRSSAPEEIAGQVRWSALALAGTAPLPPLVLAGPTAPGAPDLAAMLEVEILPPSRCLPTWAAAVPLEALRAVALAGRAAGLVDFGVNFRVGDLAYHAPSEEARRQLRATGTLLAATLALGFVSFAVAVNERRSEHAALQAEISRSVGGVLPGAAAGTERSQLQAAVEELQKRRDTLSGAAAGRPPVLEVLRQIAAAVPEQTPFEVSDLTLDADGLRFHARTNSYESVDVLKRSFQGLPGLRDPQVKDVKTAVDGRVEFRASLSFGPEGEP